MKIAVISDIHGNMEALSAVLNDIKNENCDSIFCLGDIAMAGPEPSAVIAKIRELEKDENFDLIQGNTDQYLGNYSDELVETIKKAAPVMGNAYKYDSEELYDNEKNYLKDLPAQKEITIGNIKILLVHGSPRKNDENIYPDLPIAEVEEMIKDTDADLIFCGHTHIPCGYQTNTRQTVVNAGSVGRPFSEEPKACYVILNISEDNSFEIKHKLIDYDYQSAAEKLKKRNFEGSDKLAKMLINATSRYPA